MTSPAPLPSPLRPSPDTPLLEDAVVFALRAFRGKTRKGTGIPYFTHLFSVMCLVGEHGGDEEQMIAAVLHDWLEDIDGADPAELERRYSPRVRRLVEGLSDALSHPKPPWKERKLRYIAALRSEPAELKLISAADKLHNCGSIRKDLREIGDAIWGRFRGGREGTLWYYQEVAAALAEGWQHPLGERLQEEVAALLEDAAKPWKKA